MLFGSTVLEVAIGVIFVYLLVSLVVTAAHELLASLMSWRAANLTQGIQNLLSDANGSSLAKALYNHPLIKGLAKDGKAPSYIPSATFALALLDIVAKNTDGGSQALGDIRAGIEASDIDSGVKTALLVLVDSAGNDLNQALSEFAKVQQNIETWFNNSMDRVAGWYKRKTQIVLLALSLIITGLLNVDTILIAKTLAADSVLRAAVVEQAKTIAQQPPEGATAPAPNPSSQGQGAGTISEETKKAKDNLVKSVTDLQESGIPIGWQAENWKANEKDPLFWVLKVLGLAFTAGAASLGAPFWFDTLSRFISIRSSGKPPETAKPDKTKTSAG